METAMNSNNHDSHFMNKMADLWERGGHYLGHRPAQIVGIFLGGTILIVLLAYSSLTANSNEHRIEKIQSAFCNGSAVYSTIEQKNCRHLLDQLLKNPTPEQARRLRELVKEGK